MWIYCVYVEAIINLDVFDFIPLLTAQDEHPNRECGSI